MFGSDRPEEEDNTGAEDRPLDRPQLDATRPANGNGTGEQPRAVRRRLVEVLPSLERAGKWPDGRREAHQQRLEMHRQEPVVRRSRLTPRVRDVLKRHDPRHRPEDRSRDRGPDDQAPVAERSPVSPDETGHQEDSCQEEPGEREGVARGNDHHGRQPGADRPPRSIRTIERGDEGGGGDGEPGDAGQQRHPSGGLPVEDEHVESGDDGRQRGERCGRTKGPGAPEDSSRQQVHVHQHDEEDPQHEALQRLDRPVDEQRERVERRVLRIPSDQTNGPVALADGRPDASSQLIAEMGHHRQDRALRVVDEEEPTVAIDHEHVAGGHDAHRAEQPEERLNVRARPHPCRVAVWNQRRLPMATTERPHGRLVRRSSRRSRPAVPARAPPRPL